ncbi:MAG TPA: TetR/AcrR family transcriptional regulator C-terminal domain-containing protein [Propionibacteriaceae bacterium]
MNQLVGTPSTKITAEIRRQIRSGKLAPGDRVPSTREITRRWGVAMATASKVLAALRQEGLVRTRPGVGTVVAGASPPRPRSSARPRDPEAALNRERILAAAITVADREGLGALSMRRIAAELNVGPMSLYRHVRDKDDLLNGMMDAAFAEWRVSPPQRNDTWHEILAEAARELWQIFRRHLWLAPAYSLTRPLVAASGLAYTEHVLATLLSRGVQPATAFSMHLILFNYIRGFATSLEMEATAEADTGVTADEWMDVQEPALETVLADQDLPAFRAVLESFEPDGFDMDLDALFEAGLGYLLDGFGRST